MIKQFTICLGMLAGCIAAQAATLTYTLSFDTSQLALSAMNYQFDFILSGTAGNTVTVSNPNFGSGTLLPGQPTTLSLMSNLMNFGDSAVWQFTPGNMASFTLSTTDVGPSAGFSPDNVIIALEDTQGNAYSTTDPDDALFRLALTGGSDSPEVFPGTEAPITGTSFTVNGSTGSTGSTGSVPEPASVGLVSLAALLLVSLTGRRVHPKN